jgi:hypothetical protein
MSVGSLGTQCGGIAPSSFCAMKLGIMTHRKGNRIQKRKNAKQTYIMPVRSLLHSLYPMKKKRQKRFDAARIQSYVSEER